MTKDRPARGSELLAWIASLPPDERDARVEEWLGIRGLPDIVAAPGTPPPGADLVGYHASGVDPIVQMVREVPLGDGDVLVDLGSGLGKVVILVHLLTGARARGIELQANLVARAREAAAHVGAEVRFDQGDVREADLREGTVFFLYLPFTGAALGEVLGKLRAVGARRRIVVCTLGLDLARLAPWLAPRPVDAFWLSVYDSVSA